MTVKKAEKESLRVYVAKFNIVVLETPGVDAKIKMNAFIQGLRSGSFFDSLVMNEPKDFSDLLERITPYIHLDEAWIARLVEIYKKEERNLRRRENKNRAEMQAEGAGIRNRPHATSSRGIYNNRPRENQPEIGLRRVLERMGMVSRF